MVNEKAQHTYTWLKVLAVAFLLDALLMLWVSTVGMTHLFFSPLAVWVALALAILGLMLGVLINLLSKFRFAVVTYIVGHVLSIIIGLGISEIYFNDEPENIDIEILPQTEVYDTTTTLAGSDKYAIEQVIFLMEQQYPYGAYEIIDINTEHVDNDTSNIYCTIIFTLQDEGEKKYISQYLVNKGHPEPVSIKQDTTSAVYREYKRRNSK